MTFDGKTAPAQLLSATESAPRLTCSTEIPGQSEGLGREGEPFVPFSALFKDLFSLSPSESSLLHMGCDSEVVILR